MNFLLVGAAFGACAFAAGWLIGLLVSSSVPRQVKRRSARAAFILGIAPLLVAVAAVVALVGPAFLIYEPRDTRELPGFVLLVGSAVGCALLLRTTFRLIRIALASRRLIREWTRHATPLTSIKVMPAMAIDTGHPVVVVAGLTRAALYIDRRVLETCSDDELDAIAAHELAHVESADNVKRLMLAATRGPTHTLVTCWRDAAELDADRFAATDERRGLALASALVKVARAATSPQLDALAASSVHDGGDVERRVQALLRPRPPQGRLRGAAATVIAIALVALAPLGWKSTYEAMELLVSYLP